MNNSFMSQHNCEICHKEATKYITYKEFFSFLCDNKDCNKKFDIKSGFFTTTIELKESTGE